jgi:hypothetical protein
MVHHIIVSTNTPSLEGYQYAVKYIDGAKSWQWGLKTREGSDLLATMKKLVEEELPKNNIIMRHYHADGGKELISKAVRDYLAKLKTKPKIRNTPELNAVSERKNRTDKEIVKAMLSRSGLPKAFWYKAFEHASYINDRMPTKNQGLHVANRMPGRGGARCFKS